MSSPNLLDALFVQIVRLALRLPRGGVLLARTMARFRKSLRRYPVQTRYGTITCDLRETVCLPLIRFGEYQHWRADEESFSRIPLNRDSVVLDIGANIGIMTRLFARAARHVHAFEPAPRAIPLLEANTSDLSNATIHAVALSDYEGVTYFKQRIDLDMSAMSRRETCLKVRVATVDSLKLSPDLIKMDVEGSERLVLQGAQDTIRRCRPIIVFEALTDQARQQCEDAILLADPGYRFEPMGGRTNFIAWPPSQPAVQTA